MREAGVNTGLLTKQAEKAEKELEVKRQELESCIVEKADLNVKLRMIHTELATAQVSINHMNIGSKKLEEILCSEKSNSSKHGLGYVHGASTSNTFGEFVFVKGST